VIGRRGAAALSLLLVLGACSTTSTGSWRLGVSGPRWQLAGLDVRLSVKTSGALSEVDASLNVAVGNKPVGRYRTVDGEAEISIPASALAEGPNLVSVKTGSERSEIVVHVVPIGHAAVPTAAVFVLVAIVAALRRRRRARFSG